MGFVSLYIISWPMPHVLQPAFEDSEGLPDPNKYFWIRPFSLKVSE